MWCTLVSFFSSSGVACQQRSSTQQVQLKSVFAFKLGLGKPHHCDTVQGSLNSGPLFDHSLEIKESTNFKFYKLKTQPFSIVYGPSRLSSTSPAGQGIRVPVTSLRIWVKRSIEARLLWRRWDKGSSSKEIRVRLGPVNVLEPDSVKKKVFQIPFSVPTKPETRTRDLNTNFITRGITSRVKKKVLIASGICCWAQGRVKSQELQQSKTFSIHLSQAPSPLNLPSSSAIISVVASRHQ